jgi:hypothetical protein
MKTKNNSKPKRNSTTKSAAKSKAADRRISLFDHVKHIRQIQDPNYYNNLSEDDQKSFNPFMIIRALSMDSHLVEDMASLYQYFDKIPNPQLYTLLIGLVPKSFQYSPWIKSKFLRHNKELLEVVAKRFEISTHQSNAYINILLRSKEGQEELVNICKAFGMEDSEVEKLFEEQKYDN